MTEITNQEYVEYAAKIAEKDKANLVQVLDILDSMQEDFQGHFTELKDLYDGLPTVAEGTATNARVQVNNVYAQVNGYMQQMGYLKQTIQGFAQINPDSPMAPLTAPTT